MTVYRTKENSDRDQNDNPESDRGQRIFREQDAIHDRTGAVVRSLGGAALFNLNRLLMQWVYRVEVQGLTQLPKQAPFLLTPNHVSLLDPLAIAAVLPHHILELGRMGRDHVQESTDAVNQSRHSCGASEGKAA